MILLYEDLELKIKAKYLSEMLVSANKSIRHYKPEDQYRQFFNYSFANSKLITVIKVARRALVLLVALFIF
jgi:hypothetical protein